MTLVKVRMSDKVIGLCLSEQFNWHMQVYLYCNTINWPDVTVSMTSFKSFRILFSFYTPYASMF